MRLTMSTAVPVDAPEGAVKLLQVYYPYGMGDMHPILDGDPAFRLRTCVIMNPFLFLEIQFTPRKMVRYSTHCIFRDKSGTLIRILLTAFGCDPRNPNISNNPHSILYPGNSLSRCNFTRAVISFSTDSPIHTYINILSNQESSLLVHFRLGPVHPALNIFPLEGDIEPEAFVEISISMNSSEKRLIGSIFVPCTLSLRQRKSLGNEIPESPKVQTDDETIASHSDIRVMQSVSRLICNKGVTGRRPLCERSTRSRTSKLSLEARMKLFDLNNFENSRLPDHYIGFHVVCKPHS